jgi:hypothetical protein
VVVFFFVVVVEDEDFFSDGEAEASADVEVFFLVVVEVEPEASVSVFFLAVVVEAAVVPDFLVVVADVFFAVLDEVAVVSFLLAQALIKASAIKIVMADRTDFFIGGGLRGSRVLRRRVNRKQ